jgi:membrane fusion protein (multidrug efflux system)
VEEEAAKRGREPGRRQQLVARIKRRRRPILIGAAAIVGLGVLLYWLNGRRFEDTDDAQVDADISNISSRVSGVVVRVAVVEQQRVRAGDVLADIDPTDLEVALAQARAGVADAEAQLGVEDPTVAITATSSVAALTNASSGIWSSAAALAGAEKEVRQAAARLQESQANARTAELDRTRGRQLLERNAIPRADFDRRESAATAAAAVVEGARQALAQAREHVAQQRAQVRASRSQLTEVQANTPRQLEARQAAVLSKRANLELARARQRQAELDLGYARIRTPVGGIAARKAVNVGDRVSPGQTLVAVAQVDNVWVTANFRETQIRRMHPGQRVSIHVDALARDFAGTVESLGGATGSRVSVLPPENATGNFVKVVQRIPVRIRLDPSQPEMERLRPGMSVVPKVRVTS